MAVQFQKSILVIIGKRTSINLIRWELDHFKSRAIQMRNNFSLNFMFTRSNKGKIFYGETNYHAFSTELNQKCFRILCFVMSKNVFNVSWFKHVSIIWNVMHNFIQIVPVPFSGLIWAGFVRALWCRFYIYIFGITPGLYTSYLFLLFILWLI